MDEQIRQIGERIRGLRDALDLSVEDMAGQCGLPVYPRAARCAGFECGGHGRTMWIAGRAVSAD